MSKDVTILHEIHGTTARILQFAFIAIMDFYYILGNPRSGTSMFRLILNAHPSVVAPPECGFLQWLHPQFRKTDFSSSDNRRQFALAVLASKKMETWDLDESSLMQAFESVDTPDFQSLSEEVYKEYGRQKGVRTPSALVDKNNYYIDYLQEIKDAMPAAKYIHLVRDVRDVICSYLELKSKDYDSPYAPQLSTDIREIARDWHEKNESVLSFLGEMSFVHLRYEDVVRNTKEAMEPLMEFMGLTYHPQMSEYYKLNDEPKATLGWKTRTLEPVDPSRIGRYKEILTAQQLEIIEGEAGKSLNYFGYH